MVIVFSCLFQQYNLSFFLSFQVSTLITDSTTPTSASYMLHDYGCSLSIDDAPKVAASDVQTVNNGMSAGTQTFVWRQQTNSVGVNTNKTIKVTTASQCTASTEDKACQANFPSMTYEDICYDDDKVQFFTGIPNGKAFEDIFYELTKDEDSVSQQIGNRQNLRHIDEFLMVLMRLRLGLLIEDLSERFKICRSTCSEVFTKWIFFLYINLKSVVTMPPRSTIQDLMPHDLKETFPNCRIIVDCTELKTNTASSLKTQSLTYSHYKSGMTWKGLIGITPNGVLCFVSDLYCGSIISVTTK